MIIICFVTDAKGDLVEVVSDTPIRVFTVNDHCKRDRVYELSADGPVLKIGAEHVQRLLRDEPIGHRDDWLGIGQGPWKPQPNVSHGTNPAIRVGTARIDRKE